MLLSRSMLSGIRLSCLAQKERDSDEHDLPRTQRAMLPAPAKRQSDPELARLLCWQLLGGSEMQFLGHAASRKGTAASAGALCTKTRPSVELCMGFYSAFPADCCKHYVHPLETVPWAGVALLYVRRRTYGCQSV